MTRAILMLIVFAAGVYCGWNPGCDYGLENQSIAQEVHEPTLPLDQSPKLPMTDKGQGKN